MALAPYPHLPSSSSSSLPLSPPTPSYILRHHSHPISTLHFTPDGLSLFSTDTEGYVALWDLKTRRTRYAWRACEGGVLGVREWGEGRGLLTQGRDNEIRFFAFPSSSSTTTASTIMAPPASSTPPPTASLSPAASSQPQLVWSMPINAMNFCRMSVLALLPPASAAERKGKGRAVDEEGQGAEEGEQHGLVAVVSLLKDEYVDIFHLPTQSRAHRSIGMGAFAIGEKTGSVMAVHLFQLPSSSTSPSTSSSPSTAPIPSASPPPPPPSQLPQQLHLLIAYESGVLALFRFTPTSRYAPSETAEGIDLPIPGRTVEEGEGWELVWSEKGHRDSIMSLSTTPDHRFAYTVAADHFLVKYRIFDKNEAESLLPRCLVVPTDSPGKAGVAVRDDGKVVATAGWDGELRLYAARSPSLDPLAVLTLHRSSLQAVAVSPVFPSSTPSILPDSSSSIDSSSDDSDAGEEDEGGEKGKQRTVWLAAAGQEGKISLWEVYQPVRKREGEVKGGR